MEYWPLWWCLKPGQQVQLMFFQWNNYGFRLEIPPRPSKTHVVTAIESLEEIGGLMRQPPKNPKKII